MEKDLKLTTIKFLRSRSLQSDNVNYINEKFIENLKNAKHFNIKELPSKQEGENDDLPQGLKEKQWSGFVHNIYCDDDDKFYFSTPCQVPEDYYIYEEQIVRLDQNGICGDFTQYYLVFNI